MHVDHKTASYMCNKAVTIISYSLLCLYFKRTVHMEMFLLVFLVKFHGKFLSLNRLSIPNHNCRQRPHLVWDVKVSDRVYGIKIQLSSNLGTWAVSIMMLVLSKHILYQGWLYVNLLINFCKTVTRKAKHKKSFILMSS